MDTPKYGRHYSGHREREPFHKRYPYTTGLFCTLIVLVAFLYISTHWFPTDPWGMTAAWVGGGGAFLRLAAMACADDL